MLCVEFKNYYLWKNKKQKDYSVVNKYGVKCEILSRFWENKGWIKKIEPYGWSQWYFRYWLGRRSEDDERQISGWKGTVSRFKGKLVKMIKYAVLAKGLLSSLGIKTALNEIPLLGDVFFWVYRKEWNCEQIFIGRR